jgi:hypothetical protein
MATDDQRGQKSPSRTLPMRSASTSASCSSFLYLLSPNDMQKMEMGRQEVMAQQQSNFQSAMQ